MSEKHETNCSELSKLLSLISTSRKKFKEEFKKFDKNSAAQLYYAISIEVIQAISRGSINDLEKLIKLIENIKNTTDNFHEDFLRESLVDSNLIILACKYAQVSVLEYVFNDPKVLNLFNDDSQSLVKPEDVDGEGHNAFYYAVRSGDCKLIEILVKKWPHQYFQVSTDIFSDLLSRSYAELKMKCIALSDEMKIKIGGFIIGNRFYDDGTKSKNKVSKVSHKDINRRIDLVIDNVKVILREYSAGSLDDKFFYVARFTVQNIHILKRQLKSTYIKLPWEEIEFCMIAFLGSQKKSETQHRVICNFFLTKDKLFNYLKKFSDALEVEKSHINNSSIQGLAVLPNIQREKVVTLIGKCNPEFTELYNEYRNLRDTHSLEIINDYLNLASSTNPKDRENQLIIIRALQIMGEYFKNTLESPKMSAIISDVLLSSLPQNTRKLIIGLRNSLSHAFSLSQRLQLDSDDVFFTNVQQDIKVMNRVVVNMLYQIRYQHIKRILRSIIDCENSDQVCTVLETFDFDFKNWFAGGKKIDDNQQLMQWIDELNSLMPEDETIGRNLLAKVSKLITEFTSTEKKIDYMTNMMMIQEIRESINKNYNMNANSLRILKFRSQQILSNIHFKIDVNKKNMIETSCSNIFKVIQMKLPFDSLIRTWGLISKIMYNLGCDPQTMQWIQEFRDKLNEKKTGNGHGEFSDHQNHKKINKIEIFSQRISALQSVFDRIDFVTYKNSKNLQVIVEMLVLDVLSLLNDPKFNILTNNNLFLDDYSPVLIGKNLRNHLAHGNDIVEIMPFDPMMAVFLNAKKIIAENIMESNRDIGKVTLHSLDKLMTKYEHDLETIVYQEEMYRALEEGDFKKLKKTLKNGADINGKNIWSWTALHFAAKGPNIDVTKFVLDKNDFSKVTNDSGESVLHIAAQYGRKSTATLLVENGFDVNAIDNSGQTALHRAAENGHAEIVRLLIRNKANVDIKTRQGYAPLHSAVLASHKNVVEILLQQERHVDFNEAAGGFTALHIAAEYGHTELVDYLVKLNANVNAKTHQNATPLLNAVINCHVEVVKILISHGAHVHVSDVHGITALHNAVETNREEIAEILLQHGADVNFTPAIDKFTPINYAAEKGFVNMLKLLLKYHARVNTSTVDGKTPLHYAALYGQVDIIGILIENKAIVDAKNSDNQTPLHYASSAGRDNAVEILLKKGASHNVVDCNTLTPLHAATLNGHSKCVDMLLKYNVDIEARDRDGKTALHLSSLNGHVDTTKFLITKGADINAQDSDGLTPLHIASVSGQIKIVQVLVTAGANINLLGRSDSSALELSILEGHVEIVRYFIDNKLPIDKDKIISRSIFIALSHNNQEIAKMIIENTPMNVKVEHGGELLCCAARNNQVEIVKLLLKLGVSVKVSEALVIAVTAGYKHVVKALVNHENVNVNKKLEGSATFLHLAVLFKHKSVAELLIKKGAKVNAVSSDGTSALHLAASKGSFYMIKLLLDNGADPSMKDMKNRTSLELALEDSHDHFESFRILFELMKIDVNYRCNNDENWTLLHVAAQAGSLPITEFLIEKGADIHLRNKPGSKPIHIAAREGYEYLVGYYRDKGIGMDDRGAAGWTLLHYAAVGNRTNVVNYLIDKQFDVNVTDCRFRTPLHWASQLGFVEVANILLNSGAAYDLVDICNEKPSEMVGNTTIALVFDCINRLFAAVKENDIEETKLCVDKQVVINAVNKDFVSALHYAAWKGHIEIAGILLVSGANPNICNKNGSTPLHFAAKFGHPKIVQLLLTNGAIYNAKTNKNNTPLTLATDPEIVKVLKLIDRSFINVKSGNTRVINDLKNADSLDIVKTVMNARNVDGKTLIVMGIHAKFRKVDDLKDISSGNCKKSMNAVYKLLVHEKYQEALDECDCISQRRKKYLSSNDPGILDVEFQKAYIIYKQQNYRKALDMLTDIYNKQRDVLGENDRNTLKTNCVMAMALHRLGRNEDALKLFEETCEKQKKVMAADDDDLLTTQIQMGLVLMNLGKYEEALVFYNTALEKKMSTGDVGNVLVIQNNIAMVYSLQGKYIEAMDKYQKVYELRSKVLGPNHSDTLRAMFNKIQVLAQQGKYSDALADFQKLSISQNKALGSNHVDSLKTKLLIGNIYFDQGKVVSAMKVYTSIHQPMALILGFHHPEVINLKAKMEAIKKAYQYCGGDILEYCRSNEEIREAVESEKSVEALLRSGVDINYKDDSGLTLLHYAVNNQDESTVRFLLKNNADCCLVSSKGNTALHFAVTKNNEGIVCVLLDHAKQVLKNSELHEFINAKTTSGGMTCLHVAAQKGYENIVEILLRNGAVFNCVNFVGKKTPYDLSDNDNIKRLLKLTDELFVDAKHGNELLTIKLKSYDVSKNIVILNTRNVQGQNLVNTALSNNHKKLARKLLEILKNIH